MLPLRPANLGEILDRTANLYRGRFLVFLGIAGLPSAVFLLFWVAAVLLTTSMRNNSDPAMGAAVIGLGMLALMALGVPACLGAYSLGEGALTWAANQAYIGERPAIRAAYSAAWKRGWRYVGLYTLEALIVWVGPGMVWSMAIGGLAVWAAMSHGADTAPWIAISLITLLALVCGLWMLARLSMAFAVSVAEDAEVTASLKRAWRLSVGTRWRLLAVFVLRVCLGWVAAILLAVPPLIALSLIPKVNSPQHTQTMGVIFAIVFYGASFLGQAMARPVSAIATVVFCYDQRIRREAFDIEWMMRQAGMVETPAAPMPQTPWTAMPAVVAVPPAMPAVVEQAKLEPPAAAPEEHAGESGEPA